MALGFEDIVEELDKTYQQMKFDGIKIGLIAYIGGTPEQIARYFSERFCCEYVNIPSTGIKKNLNNYVKLANPIYRHFPEFFRKPLSLVYKYIRKRSETCFPNDFNFNEVLHNNDLAVLLVDDSTFTGKTLDFWKSTIKQNTGKEVYSFSITVVGNYTPDYFCFEKWHSFAWRPIGV